ncbi:hypothetical protein BT96DRAFT_965067 [Gymnopus androsaceus JB14]|uniref:Amino acid permease/ SLC12A domain-containing protein n=1 Tax=Gymnopus androsaceus JB14 TaxID=1447944 RepID=A0A6A4HSP3_9AGAR|nr:hypothetical protein BT96DRAFT_965067 [Gymnopus androsaceus JB14]
MSYPANGKDEHSALISNQDIESASVHIKQEDVFVEEKDLKRGLKQRHIQMIAFAGTIGTGLFLGSGLALTTGGPVGAFLGYLFTGILVSGVVISIAEMTALVPLTGSAIRQSEYFVDPALSFAQGWNGIYTACVGFPAEITAGAILVDFWTTSVSNGVWITILAFLVISVNMLPIRVYGELEFGFSMLKILLIVGLVIMGLCIDLGGVSGQPRLGFQYWRNPGPFVQYLGIPGTLGRFLGFWKTFSSAAYAYSGVEGIAAAASETQNPRRNIPKAAKRIFWRVLLFYVITIFIVTLIVPSNSKDLLRATGNAAQSPFVIAATLAGIKVVPHIMNAVVLTSAWSALNSGMLGASRVLYGLASEGHAPRFFLKTNRFGIPYLCVAFIGSFMALAYMTLSTNASTVFTWFQDMSSTATLVNWSIICLVYLRFYYGCKHQGIDRKELPWAGPFQPYAAWVFIHGQWSTETFVAAYFDIPLIFAIYFGYKLVKRTKIVSYEEMPIRYYMEIARQNPEPPEKPLKGWKRLAILWS